MKTVKFKDLPSKVKHLMIRMNGAIYDQNYDIDLDWLHTLPYWSKATDEERLAYAEWRYPIGTTYISTQGATEIVNEGCRPYISPLFLHDINIQGTVDRIIYDFDMNKWAEIISEPEKEDFEMKAIIKKLSKRDSFYNDRHLFEGSLMERKDGRWYFIDPLDIKKAGERFDGNGFYFLNPEIQEQPEFKAGDEVAFEHSNTAYEIIHIFDGIAWVKSENQTYGTLAMLSHLRKPDPDPDSKLREIAKEMLKKNEWEEYDAFYIQTLEMLIEALKKGKDL